jgi:hypothetical protein
MLMKLTPEIPGEIGVRHKMVPFFHRICLQNIVEVIFFSTLKAKFERDFINLYFIKL